MPSVRVGEVELCLESFGHDGDPAVLLIHGLGGQLTSWDEAFCRRLAAGGYRVIRFDQRDGGLSAQIEAPKVPIRSLIAAGESVHVPYDLTALADDAVGLLDALGLARAHVVGQSMGGMVAQTMAIRHPKRVESLVSIISSPRSIPVDDIESSRVRAALMTAPPPDRVGTIEFFVAAHEALSGGGPFDEAAVRAHTTAAVDRSFKPAGTGRQFAAMVASGDRTEDLHAVENPTLVLHGTLDPLIDISEGRATATAIPGARFVPIPGMGHQLPFPLEFSAGIGATILRFLDSTASQAEPP